jgi:hypothetical protein
MITVIHNKKRLEKRIKLLRKIDKEHSWKIVFDNYFQRLRKTTIEKSDFLKYK